MAEKKTATASAATENTETKTAEKKFTVDALAKYSRDIFGVSSCTYAGAAAKLSGKYSVDEMKSGIICPARLATATVSPG